MVNKNIFQKLFRCLRFLYNKMLSEKII
ncbi:helix-turn-helix domain-containing protein [Borreliella burgdorferi]